MSCSDVQPREGGPTKKQSQQALDRFGVPIDATLQQRERLANRYDFEFGQERIFPELVEALLKEVPEGARVLEVGAATGLLTGPLLKQAGHLTALEPSEGMLRRLIAKDVAESPRLTVVQGMAEDLLHDAMYEVAVVTFTPRRGVGLLRLLHELASRVSSKVVLLLDEDNTFDWAYLARAAAVQGFNIRLCIIVDNPQSAPADQKRAVLMVADVRNWTPQLPTDDAWVFEARTIEVPYPVPHGTATRLVRYFLTGGDRALIVHTHKDGLERLYGNLRTAAHRLGRDEVTVRSTNDGIQIVRLPKSTE
jgi:SAM-dependent methyltransferase